MTSPSQAISWTLLLGLICIGHTGCNGSSSPAAATSGPEKIQSSEESWGAIVLQGEKIGHQSEKIEHLTLDDVPYVRTTTVEELVVQRDGQSLKARVENVFLETPKGELRKFTTNIDQAGSITRFTGEVAADGQTLKITSHTGNDQSTTIDSIPWQPEYGGAFAAWRQYHEPPLKADEAREVTALVPTLNRPGQIRVTGRKKEDVTLLDGATYKLLKVSEVTKVGGQPPMKSTVWLDEDGDVVKLMMTGQNFELYRCSKEFALSENAAVSFDLALDTIVPVKGMPTGDELEKLDEMSYRLTLDNSNPAEIFVSETNQKVTPIDEHSAKLTVWRIPDTGNLPKGLPAETPPTDAEKSAGPLVQVDDPAVKKLAKQFQSSEKEPVERALALEKFVHFTIQEKNFSQGFLSAAEVAEGKVGDCTEHAVLLMALLRAEGIPARGALGLVYIDYGPKKGFAYHMWTEAWVGDRWLPLDATRGAGGIGVDYIKVTQTDLSGSGAFAAFLPVSQVVGQLKIEVED